MYPAFVHYLVFNTSKRSNYLDLEWDSFGGSTRGRTLVAHLVRKLNPADPVVYAGDSVWLFCCGLQVETLILVGLVAVGSGSQVGPACG